MPDLADKCTFEAAATVLVVEDEVLLRLLICDSLTDAGLSVVVAGSGDEALDLLATGTAVDLVLTDLRMPGATGGLELAEAVSASAARVPVIIMSGDAAVAALNGRYPLLLKPFPTDKMVEAVCETLQSIPKAPATAAPVLGSGTARAARARGRLAERGGGAGRRPRTYPGPPVHDCCGSGSDCPPGISPSSSAATSAQIRSTGGHRVESTLNNATPSASRKYQKAWDPRRCWAQIRPSPTGYPGMVVNPEAQPEPPLAA